MTWRCGCRPQRRSLGRIVLNGLATRTDVVLHYDLNLQSIATNKPIGAGRSDFGQAL